MFQENPVLIPDKLCSVTEKDPSGKVIGHSVCKKLLYCDGHDPDICLPDRQFVPEDALQALRVKVEAGEISVEAIRSAMENLISQN